MEELGRFTRQESNFSRRRLTFFLNRTWILSRGMAHALATDNEKEYDRLTWSPPVQPLAAGEFVCLGVVKKVAEKAFVMFDFRLRALSDSGPVKVGQALSWSAVFPINKGQDIPPEGFLHLPQKQKFAPFLLLEKKSFMIQHASVTGDESGTARLTFTEQGTLTQGKPFAEWSRFLAWSPQARRPTREAHAGPLDLETELQEEVILRDYEIGHRPTATSRGRRCTRSRRGLAVHAVVGAGAEGKALKECMNDLRKLKKNRPPLFGLMHYEKCRLVFQPLATFDDNPDYITVSKENVNKAALLKAMKFT